MASTDVKAPSSTSLRGIAPYVSSAALCDVLELEDKIDESTIRTASFVSSSSSSAIALSSSSHSLPLPLQTSASTPLSSTLFPFVTHMTSSSIQQRGSTALHFVIPSLFTLGKTMEASGCRRGAPPPTSSRMKSIGEVETVNGDGRDRNKGWCPPSCDLSSPTHPGVSLREEFVGAGGFSGTISNTAFSLDKGYFSSQRPWTTRMKQEAGVKVAQQMFLQEYCPLSSPFTSSWQMKENPSPLYPTPPIADSSLSSTSLSVINKSKGYHRHSRVLRLHPFFLRQVALRVLTLLQGQQQHTEPRGAHALSSSSTSQKRSLSKIWLLDCTPVMIRFAVLPNGVSQFPHTAPEVFRLVFLTGAEWKRIKGPNEENRNGQKEAIRLRSLFQHRGPRSQDGARRVPHAASPHCYSSEIITAIPRFASATPSADYADVPPSSAPAPQDFFPLSNHETHSFLENEKKGEKRSREMYDEVLNTGEKESGLGCSFGCIARKQEGWKAVVGAFQLLKEKKKLTKEECTGTRPLRLRYRFYWEPTEKEQDADNAKQCSQSFSPITTSTNPSDGKGEEKKWWDQINSMMMRLFANEVKEECSKGKSDPHWVPDTLLCTSSAKFNESSQEMGENERKNDASEETTELCTVSLDIIQNVSWFPPLASSLLPSHSPIAQQSLSSSPTVGENIRVKSIVENNENMNMSASEVKFVLKKEEESKVRDNVDPTRVDERNGSMLETTAHEGSRAVPGAAFPPISTTAKSSTPDLRRASHCRLEYAECIEGEGRNWSFSLFTFAAHLSWCEFIMDTVSILPSFSNVISAGVKSKQVAKSVSASGHMEIGGDTPSSMVISHEESISAVKCEEFSDFLILLTNPSEENIVPLPASQSNPQSLSRRRKWASFLVLSFAKKATKPTFTEMEAKGNGSTSNYPLGFYANETEGMMGEEEMRKYFVIIKVDGCSEMLQWCVIPEERIERCQSALQSVEGKGNFCRDESRDAQSQAMHVSTLQELLFFLKQ